MVSSTSRDAFKHAGEHAGDAIAQGGKDAGKGIKHQGDDLIHGDTHKAKHDAQHDASSAATHARHSADEIGDDLKDAFMATLDDITKLGDKVKSELNHAYGEFHGKLEHDFGVWHGQLEHDFGAWKGQLETGFTTWRGQLNDIGASYKQLGQDLNSDLEKSGKAIKEDIESATDTAIKKLTSSAMKHGLEEADKVVKALHGELATLEDKFPHMVDALNNIGNSIELGPIELNYASFYARAEELSDALDKALQMVNAGDFRLTQTFFNDLVKGLGPDSLTINAEIEFFSRFGLDLQNISMDLFTELADFVLDELGVPKE